ncbi:MAG: oligosaccharide flippase family protein [Lachnospiraceae bacterium]|nr:oligosaccharide flippase family protein [Lachnospiraceae bacterium]
MSGLMDKWRKMPQTVKASAAYAVCSILQKCISFITMPFFMRMLSTEQFGEVTLYGTWSGIITIFLTLNLAYGSFATAMVKFEDDRDGYISSVQGISIYLSLVFLVIYVPLRDTFNVVFELPTPIILLMIAEIITLNSWTLWAGKKRFEYKWKSIVALTLVNSLLSPLLAFIIVLNTEQRGLGRIYGFAIPGVAIGLVLFVINTVRGKKTLNKQYWEYALRFNIPLIAYYLSQTIFNMSDRIMISHIIDKDAAGVYGAAYTLAMILTFVLNAINNSYEPWFFSQLKAGKHDENRSVSLAIALLMSLLLCGIIWFAPEVIFIYAGDQYGGAVYVVLPVAMSVLLLFYSQLFINVEFYYERKKELVWASIGSALINIVLNWFLIPRFGIVAAGYTTFVSYIVFVFCNYLAMKKILKQENVKDDMFDYKMLILLLVAFCVLSAIGALLYSFLWIRIVVAALVLIAMFIKRNYFIGMYKKIKG